MTTPESIEASSVASPTRVRWSQPKEFPEQLIMMASTEMANAVRDWAATHDLPVSKALRELVQRGIDTMTAPMTSDPFGMPETSMVFHFPKPRDEGS